MKKFLAFILAALMLLALAACGSNGGNTDPQPDNDQNQMDEPGKGDTTKNSADSVKEFFGYSFTFNGSVVEKSTTDGHIAEAEEYSIFIYCFDDIAFDTWENIGEIALRS